MSTAAGGLQDGAAGEVLGGDQLQPEVLAARARRRSPDRSRDRRPSANGSRTSRAPGLRGHGAGRRGRAASGVHLGRRVRRERCGGGGQAPCGSSGGSPPSSAGGAGGATAFLAGAFLAAGFFFGASAGGSAQSRVGGGSGGLGRRRRWLLGDALRAARPLGDAMRLLGRLLLQPLRPAMAPALQLSISLSHVLSLDKPGRSRLSLFSSLAGGASLPHAPTDVNKNRGLPAPGLPLTTLVTAL